jgi:hypothetical protein
MFFCRGAEAQAYLSVIPAEAGIHLDLRPESKWIPACAGMTNEERNSRRQRSTRTCSCA